jgi:hypothetical protein
MSCQICNKSTNFNTSMCKTCFKFIKVEQWNQWIRNTPKNKRPKKVKFSDKDIVDYTRSIREEIDLIINQEVMVSIQDIISTIVEKKKKTCFKFTKVQQWNKLMKNTPKNKKPRGIKFSDKDMVD